MKARLIALAGMLMTAASLQAGTDPTVEASRYLERGNYRAAVERLRGAAPFAREQVEARFLYATALAGAGEREKAVQMFEQLIADFPAQPEPYNNLAALYASLGQLDKAKEVLERAMRTHASYAAVYDNLSTIYVEMARASYVKALRVNEAPQAPNLQLLYAVKEPAAGTSATTTLLAAAETAPAPAKPEPKAVSAPEPARADARTPETVKPEPKAPAPEAAPVAPAPKAPPVNLPNAVPAAALPDAALVDTLQQWAKAWSSRDVEGYLGFYAPDFNPVGRQTRAQWEAERRERISKAENLSVTLQEPKVRLVNDRRAVVTLVQEYAAANYSDRTRKQFTMVKVEGRWLIRNEKSLGLAP